MSTATAATKFEAMADRIEFEGFGYIGERATAIEERGAAAVEAIDRQVLALAEKAGLDDEQLFEWANSRLGRYFGGAVFSGYGRVTSDIAPQVVSF